MKLIGRGWWIRTTESSANGFTVRPLWPLGKPSIIWSWRRESNPQPADYKSAALPLSHASKLNSSSVLIKLAIRNGLEPSTSSVTGWHSNQLNYRTAYSETPSEERDRLSASVMAIKKFFRNHPLEFAEEARYPIVQTVSDKLWWAL